MDNEGASWELLPMGICLEIEVLEGLGPAWY